MHPWLRRALYVGGGLLGFLGLAFAALWGKAHHPRPPAAAGPEAEALAQRVMAAVHVDAWSRTGAVRWTFGGRNQHLWDRRRQLARVRFSSAEVLVDLSSQQGRALRGGAPVPEGERAALVKKAYAAWINDSFWLNPLAKLYDGGVERKQAEGGGLLIQYRSGGLTPGDSYLWLLGEDGRPRAWRMWVSILPIGGLEASWEDWVTLRTGALVATRHRIEFFTLALTQVDGAATLEELEPGPDPFAPLLR